MNFFAVQNFSKTKLILLFAIKLIAGFIACLIYTNYYSNADFYVYYTDSKLLLEHLVGNNTQIQMAIWNSSFDPVIFNSSRTMIILNAIIRLFSFGNFYVHIVFFCFFSFIGLVGLFKSFDRHFPTKTKRLIIGIFLVPTVLFWTSTVLKETLAIGIVGLIIYLTDFGLSRSLSWKHKIVLAFLFGSLFFVKIYVALALIPVILVNMIISRSSTKMILIKYVAVFIFLASFAYAITLVNNDYNLLQLISNKQVNAISEARGGVFLVNDKNFICVDYYSQNEILSSQEDGTYKIYSGSKYLSWKLDNMTDTTFIFNSSDSAKYKILYAQKPAHSVVNLKRLKPELMDYIFHSPFAIINVLSRPSIFEISSWLHLVVAIENLWILLLIILSIIFYDKKNHEKKEILLFALLFSIILFLLIGFTSPVMGAMIRYRTIGLVFFIPLCLLMIDKDKLRV